MLKVELNSITLQIEAGSELGGPESRHPTCVSAEVVGAQLRSLVGDQTQGADSTDQEV